MINLIIRIRRFLIEHLSLLKGCIVVIKARLIYRGRIRIGRGLRVYGPLPMLHCASGGEIVIGNNVVMRNDTRSNYIGIVKPTSIISIHGGKVYIGSFVGLSGVSICAHKLIRIMDFATIGANVFIVDSDFHSMDPGVREEDSRTGRTPSVELIASAPVAVGAGAFVGLNSVVLKGSNIGSGSVVGAGVVIAGDVPDFCVAVGQKFKLIGNEMRHH